MLLSLSGEVANFLDDDQFGYGQSVMKCGYEIVSLFWHSTRPGVANPYTSAQIHAMAHTDYEHFNGADTSSNERGMTNQQLYDDLHMHGFTFVVLPLDWSVIRQHLSDGLPVILGGVLESTVFDLALNGHVPYPWIHSGAPDYSHVIMATGLRDAESLRFRDTANVDGSGRLRPGPRFYKTDGMQFTTATAVVPTWLADSPPVIVRPPTPPSGPDMAAIRRIVANIQTESGELLKMIPVQ